MKQVKPLVILIASLSSLTACNQSPQSADQVFINGKVYTADNQKQSTAFAIRDGAFIYVGDSESARDYINSSTEVIDLNGKSVLPGLHDNHIHPGGIVEFERCDLEGTSLDLSELSDYMSACLERLKTASGDWLIGEQWSFSLGNNPTEEFATIRAALDAVSTEIPIALSGNDGHHSAYNSAALNLAKDSSGKVIGINKNTVKKEFAHFKEVIGVDVSGEPDGMVNEQARNLMGSPSMLEGDIDKIIEHADQIPKRLNATGITSIRDAAYVDSAAPYYKTLSEKGILSLRVNLSQFHNPMNYAGADGKVNWEQLSNEAAKIRDKYINIPNISANSLKVFIDGVAEGNPYSTPPALPNAASLENYLQPIFSYDQASQKLTITGYVEPESEACQSDKQDVSAFIAKHGHHPDQCVVSNGVLESPKDVELEFVKRFDAEGYTLHLHVIGDRALRTALEAFEGAAKANGPAKQPHSLGHIQFVHQDDIKRIGDLGLYLAYTYAWITAESEYDMTVVPFMDKISGQDELYQQQNYSYTQAYPVKSTQQAGAILIAGSDAPVDTRDPRPFTNMQQAITRAGVDGTVYNPAEKISIFDVIDAYTINGAKAMGQEQLVGSIAVGKRADFIILNQNIIELAETNPTVIKDTKVMATWFDGKKVYDATADKQ